tara:strand:+ start:4150 stop:4767 length:618 start_codon:yes stop_codon:yes gene_type:complete
MKNILSIFILPLGLFSQQYTSIPDPNFEQAIINYGLDFFLDGIVETDAIDTVKYLQISGSNINDLTGIEDFSDLQSLFCQNNNLTNLDLSNNQNLFEVTCSNNQLDYINVKNGNNSGLWYFLSINNPNLLCIDVNDVAYCEYSWSVDSWTTFSNNCNPNYLYNKNNTKKIIKVTDLLGKETKIVQNKTLLYLYSDGTVEKKIFYK